ncbi:hypothetical protein [Streptomyces sp. WAC08241]|uniref:hypothetical protein n=1 Tax=Streptomyces sp. WAC08241 TaxID=2487421 RepID=UPI000F76EAA4|nr:hypothetical protein [Streptomyces sp. WAC08241]RSS32279.1 hypothetical protein EF906_34205 [Streptomyces sp. WAC08241]
MTLQLELPLTADPPRQINVIRDLADYGTPPVTQAETPPTPGPERKPLRWPAVPATPRVQHMTALARMRAAAVYMEEQATLTPAQIADRRTSLADAHTALCILRGNTSDDIDPARGYSLTRQSYEHQRRSWISYIKLQGFSTAYDLEPLRKAVAYWEERRPQFADGDDWLAAGLAAYREHWQDPERACYRPACDGIDEEDENR